MRVVRYRSIHRLFCDIDLEVHAGQRVRADPGRGWHEAKAAKHTEGGHGKNVSVAGEEKAVKREPRAYSALVGSKEPAEREGLGNPRSAAGTTRLSQEGSVLGALHGFGRSKPSRG